MIEGFDVLGVLLPHLDGKVQYAGYHALAESWAFVAKEKKYEILRWHGSYRRCRRR